MRKKISIAVPCYNEEGNVKAMAETLVAIMEQMNYDYEIVFTDNCSTDKTREILRQLASKNKRIKVLMNNRNYGVDRSFRNMTTYLDGDAILYLPCDFQEPPELIPEFIKYWEEGYKVVYGQKIGSEEGKLKYSCRNIFYKLIDVFSEVPIYRHMSGLYLTDRDVYQEYLKTDADMNFRYVLADMGYEIKLIQYVQQKRRSGKSSYNLWRSLTFVMDSMVNTSTTPLRIMTIFGFCMSVISFMIGVIYLVMKLTLWHRFQAGVAPLLIGMLFLGAVQLFFLGILGEYIGAVLRKVSKRPDVIVNEKLNFDTCNNKDER